MGNSGNKRLVTLKSAVKAAEKPMGKPQIFCGFLDEKASEAADRAAKSRRNNDLKQCWNIVFSGIMPK